MKELKIRLPKTLFEDFYRLFPGYGERQIVLRRLVIALVERSKEEKDFLNSLLDSLLED
jgi:hypothetical protein